MRAYRQTDSFRLGHERTHTDSMPVCVCLNNTLPDLTYIRCARVDPRGGRGGSAGAEWLYLRWSGRDCYSLFGSLHEGAATARWRSSKTRQTRIQFRHTLHFRLACYLPCDPLTRCRA